MSANYLFGGDVPDYQDFQPFRFNRVFHKSDEGKQKETSAEKEFSKIALAKFDRAETAFAPLREEMATRADSMNTDAAKGFTRGLASQATQTAYSKVRDKVNDQANMAGLNPNSGRAKSANDELTSSTADSTGENMARAENSQMDEQQKAYSNIVSLGSGESTTAQAGLGGLADAANAKATQDAYRDFNEDAAMKEAAGTLAGMATSYGLSKASAPGAAPQVAGRQGDADFNYGLKNGQMLA